MLREVAGVYHIVGLKLSLHVILGMGLDLINVVDRLIH